jgi:hypothetical protein
LIPEADAVRIATQAAREIRRNPTLIRQLELGRGLLVGRRKTQQQLCINRIKGKDYSAAFDRWLATQPELKAAAEAVDPHVRSTAMWCVENWPDVLTFIKGLDNYQKQRMTARGIMGALKPRLEGKPAKSARKAKPTPPPSHDEIADAVRKATQALAAQHAAEIAALRAAHDKEIERLTKELREKAAERARRAKQPVFDETEIKQLRKALHPDGKPPELFKMFNEATQLFNDRAELLVRAAKRAKAKATV